MNDSRDAGPQLTDADLEALLKRRRLDDPRRERVLKNVLAAVSEARAAAESPPAEAPRLRIWWRRWPGLSVLSGAVALSVAVVVVRTRSPGDGWRSRGGADRAASASFDVGCSGGSLARCPAGSTLIFRAQGAASGGYLSAYADPLAPGGERIRYFTDLTVQANRSDTDTAPVTLRSGVRVGPEHAPGAYDVHLILSRKPLASGESTVSPEAITAEQIDRLVVVPR